MRACVHTRVHFGFLLVFYRLPDSFLPYPSTLHERQKEHRKGEEGKTSWLSDSSCGMCNMSHKMTKNECKDLCFAQCLMTEYQNSPLAYGNMQRHHHSLWDAHKKRSMCAACVCLTFTGDVMFAGCGETSAAVAVDGCHSKLVPTLRSQIWQNRIFRECLNTQTHGTIHRLGFYILRHTGQCLHLTRKISDWLQNHSAA